MFDSLHPSRIGDEAMREWSMRPGGGLGGRAIASRHVMSTERAPAARVRRDAEKRLGGSGSARLGGVCPVASRYEMAGGDPSSRVQGRPPRGPISARQGPTAADPSCLCRQGIGRRKGQGSIFSCLLSLVLSLCVPLIVCLPTPKYVSRRAGPIVGRCCLPLTDLLSASRCG